MGSEEKSRPIQCNAGTVTGPFWFIGWLFTVAFANLVWWKALLALVIWPYYGYRTGTAYHDLTFFVQACEISKN
jgi:hypothetical protein